MSYLTILGPFAIGFIMSILFGMNNELRKIRRALEKIARGQV